MRKFLSPGVLILLAIAVFEHLRDVFGVALPMPWILAGLLVLVSGPIRGFRSFSSIPVVLVYLFSHLESSVLPESIWRIPALGFFIPVAAAWMISIPFPALFVQFRWARTGHPSRSLGLFAAATALISAAALIALAHWTDNLGVGVAMSAPLRAMPKAFALGIGVPAFALINALAEEIFYRGVVQEAARKAMPGPISAVALTASLFACAHFAGGFPNGRVGYAMVFVYGVALCELRRRSRGMLAPYLTHVAADLVIGGFLVLS